MADPKTGAAMDATLSVAGKSLAGLRPWVGDAVAGLGPVKAKLTAKGGGNAYRLAPFELAVGKGRFDGSLSLDLSGTRPRVDLDLGIAEVDLRPLFKGTKVVAGSPTQASRGSGSRTISITLVTALWNLRSSRRVLSSGLTLIAVNILATAAWLLLNHEPASLLSDLSGLAFLALTTWAAGRELFRLGPVDPNKIVGALCVYVLIGVIWAMLYQLLEGFQPGSFSGLGQQGHALSWRFLYFSFVTLTTLGYGDVLPLSLYAQSLTYMETVLGQFYLAVLVAALVSAYLSDRENTSETAVRDRAAG